MVLFRLKSHIYLSLLLVFISGRLFAEQHVITLKGSPDDAIGLLLSLKQIKENDSYAKGVIILEGPAGTVAFNSHFIELTLRNFGLEQKFEVMHGFVWDDAIEKDIRAKAHGLGILNELYNSDLLSNLLTENQISAEIKPPDAAINKLIEILSGQEKVNIRSFSEGSTLIGALSGHFSLASMRQAASNGLLHINSELFGDNIKEMRWMAGGRLDPKGEILTVTRSWAILFSIFGGSSAVKVINAITAHPRTVVFGTSRLAGNLKWSKSLYGGYGTVANGLGLDSSEVEQINRYLTIDLSNNWIEAVKKMLLESLPEEERSTEKGQKILDIPPNYASTLGAFVGMILFDLKDNGLIDASSMGRRFEMESVSYILSNEQLGISSDSLHRLSCRRVKLNDTKTVESHINFSRPVGTALAFSLAQMRSNLEAAQGGGIDANDIENQVESFRRVYDQEISKHTDNDVFEALLRHYSFGELFSGHRLTAIENAVPLIIFTDSMVDDVLGLVPLFQTMIAIKSKRPIYIITQSFDTQLQKAYLHKAIGPFEIGGLDISIVAGSGGDTLDSETRRKLNGFAITGGEFLSSSVLNPQEIALFGNNRSSEDGLGLLEELLIKQQVPVDIIALSDVRDLAILAKNHGFHALKSVNRIVALGMFKWSDNKAVPAYNGSIFNFMKTHEPLMEFFRQWQDTAVISNWRTEFYHLPTDQAWSLDVGTVINGGRVSHDRFGKLLDQIRRTTSFRSLGRMLYKGYSEDSDSFNSSLKRHQLDIDTVSVSDIYAADSLATIAAISLLFENNPTLTLKLPEWTHVPMDILSVSEDGESIEVGRSTDERVRSFMLESRLGERQKNKEIFASVLLGSLKQTRQAAQALDNDMTYEATNLGSIANNCAGLFR